MTNLTLNVGDKFTLNGIQGYITEFKAAKNNNGNMEEINGFQCNTRPTFIKSVYSVADNQEQADYDNAPKLKNDDVVFINNLPHVVSFVNSYSYDFANMIEVENA